MSEIKRFASMSQVVMKKEELVKALTENKARHDALFDAAVVGYWESAAEEIKRKRESLSVSLNEFQEDVEIKFNRIAKKIEAKETLPNTLEVNGLNWSSTLNLAYPENHTKDYERALRMITSSIYDEVELSEHEFDQYVLNNWQWKNKFLFFNSAYISNSSKSLATYYPLSGSNVPLSISGAYYSSARNETLKSISDGNFNNVKF